MHQVHENHNAQAVRGVDQVLQLLRSSRPPRRSKERRHVVSEASIVGMLSTSHELDAVVTHALDTWKDIVRKIRVRGNYREGRTHSNVGLVHLEILRLDWAGMFELVTILDWRLPEDAVEEVCGVVLPCKFCPGRHALDPLAIVAFDSDLELTPVRDLGSSISIVWECHRPPSKAFAAQGHAVLPVVEFANQEDLLRVRQPLSVDVAVVILGAVEAKDLVAFRELIEATLILLQLGLPPLVAVNTIPDLSLDALQRWIDLENFERHGGLLSVGFYDSLNNEA
mmetsp:Transcript_13633/g.30990  ORF Transcript_13633/g.30990 Transcript_13633/m.30990 type:complete len:282 (+) Transcript_13633:5258-6103(+)